MIQIIKYDIEEFKFKELISSIINIKYLELIHEEDYDDGWDEKNYKKDLGKSLQETKFHRLYYNNGDCFLKEYKRFIKKIIQPLYDIPILYQKIPTFRIHAHESRALGYGPDDYEKNIIKGVHRDRDFNHSEYESNFYLPFTDTNEQNTIWVESQSGKKDYSPMMPKYGEVYKWNGANLYHGNKENQSGKSRISVDFRILPLDKYDEKNIKSSLTNKMKLTIGEYWEKI